MSIGILLTVSAGRLNTFHFNCRCGLDKALAQNCPPSRCLRQVEMRHTQYCTLFCVVVPTFYHDLSIPYPEIRL
jgi:hypothetical protein